MFINYSGPVNISSLICMSRRFNSSSFHKNQRYYTPCLKGGVTSSTAALLQAALHCRQAAGGLASCGVSVFACKALSSRQEWGKHGWTAPWEAGPECDNHWLSKEINVFCLDHQKCCWDARAGWEMQCLTESRALLLAVCEQVGFF